MSFCRLPAEWESQSGVMLTWPHDGGDWAPYLELVEPVFVRLAVEIAKREQLIVSCRDDGHLSHIQAFLNSAGVDPSKTALQLAPSNDTWVRDHGPIGVKCGTTVELCDFQFDGWGKKYAAELDNAVSGILHTQGAFGGLELKTVDLVLEGGAVETDGHGTLLATRRCVLDEKRNPGMTEQQMETVLGQRLGLDRFLWLDHGGLAGDDLGTCACHLARRF